MPFITTADGTGIFYKDWGIINAGLLDVIGAPEEAERPFILATPNVE